MDLTQELEQASLLDKVGRKLKEKELRKKYKDKTIKVYSKKYLEQADPVTMDMKRELLENTNILEELMIIINQYFPYLNDKFSGLYDKRKKITYEMNICLFTKLFALCSGINSMKAITDNFNTKMAISNMNNIFNTEHKHLPHHDTLDDIIKTLTYEELEDIQTSMIKTLIKGKILDKYRFNNCQFLIVIDGTMLFNTDKDLGEHAITQTFNKGSDDEYSLYGYYVLEAKLVCEDFVFSLASEFIENSNMTTEEDKQDCELKAAYRLLDKIKKRFPKLPIIISGDALYAKKKFMDYCTNYGFDYLIRYKQGAMSTIEDEFNGLETIKIDNYEYVNNLSYGSGTKASNGETNIIRYTEDDTEFTYITSLEINMDNYIAIVVFGRKRWKIENQGFKEQKKGVLNIEHITSKNFNCTRNNYLLIQFAHTILNLLYYGNVLVKQLKETKKRVSELIKITLTQIIVPLNLTRNIQLRLT